MLYGMVVIDGIVVGKIFVVDCDGEKIGFVVDVIYDIVSIDCVDKLCIFGMVVQCLDVELQYDLYEVVDLFDQIIVMLFDVVFLMQCFSGVCVY